MAAQIEVVAKAALAGDELPLAPVRVGRVSAHLPTADLFVVGRDEHGPRLRIDVYSDPAVETFPFTEARWWAPWVAIGFGHVAYLVSLDGKSVITYPLGAYFGSFHAGDGYLLVASAEQLFCLDSAGRLSWASPALGIDGVVVHQVSSGVIAGEGEWDPPGGWRPFRLSLDTGRPA